MQRQLQSHEAISTAIIERKITAISLDTSIFDKFRWGLNVGLLKRLQQFKESEIKLVLSDVVQSEVISHIREGADETQKAIRKDLKSLQNFWQIGDTPANFEELIFSGKCPTGVAEENWKSFLQATGAKIVSSDSVSVKSILARYFERQPPFSQKDSKKAEFPDAIALCSLEEFAAQENTNVLVVTDDDDWLSFCEQSGRLIAIRDLSTALTCFQEDSAKYISKLLEERLRGVSGIAWREEIKQAIEEQIQSLTIEAEADSDFYYEQELVSLTVTDVLIEGLAENIAMEPIDFAPDDFITVEIYAHVYVDLEFQFVFYAWDSIDRQYLRLESKYFSKAYSDSFLLLVTFSTGKVVHKLQPEVTIDSIELMGSGFTVNLGVVGPTRDISDLD